MATELGGCLARVFKSRPGRLGMYFLCSALASVEREGEKRAAWAKATSWAGLPCIALAAILCGADDISVGRGRQTCQRLLVEEEQWP